MGITNMTPNPHTTRVHTATCSFCFDLQVCFSLQLDSLVLVEYLGPSPAASAHAASLQQQELGFNRCVAQQHAYCV